MAKFYEIRYMHEAKQANEASKQNERKPNFERKGRKEARVHEGRKQRQRNTAMLDYRLRSYLFTSLKCIALPVKAIILPRWDLVIAQS